MNKTINNAVITLSRVIITLSIALFPLSMASAQQTPTSTEEESKVDVLFGKQTKDQITSSISTINSDAISNSSVLAFGNSLYGKIPGLFVKQASGEPGWDYPTMYIRGKHTFSGTNTPLVIVDGFPRDMNTLSVDEVASVSVLKDAAATALYGMDGANGVILVTTKRGYTGRTTINFKAEYGVKMPTVLPQFYGSYDYANFYNMALKNDGKESLYTPTQLEGYRTGSDPMLYPDVNWFDETIDKAAPTSNYMIDVRGGNKTAKFYVNLGYGNDEGIYKNTEHSGDYSTNCNLDRFTLRTNLDINITKYLSLKVDLAGRMENLNNPALGANDIWNNLYVYHPNVSPVYVIGNQLGGSNKYSDNPVGMINERGYTKTHRRLFQSNFNATYDLSNLVEGLSVGVNASFDNFYKVQNGYKKSFSVVEVLGKNNDGTYQLSSPYGQTTNLTGWGPGNEAQERTTNFEGVINYVRRFGHHDISSVLIYHQDENISSVYTPDKRMFGAARISYGYKERYFADVAAQVGGTEHFQKRARFGFFPSFSAGWIASKENFMKSVTWIDHLKIRASAGLVGNQDIGGTRFGYRTLYSGYGGGWNAGTSNAGTGSGVVEGTIGNPYLTWERSFKTDAGFDLTVLKSFNILFTYFYEKRSKILTSSLSPAYLGVKFGDVNEGEVEAAGFELTLAQAKQHKNWGYNISASASYNVNRVASMKEEVKRWSYLYSQGKAIGQQFGFIAEGYYTADEIANSTVFNTIGNVMPGSIKYRDVNQDNVIDNDDMVAIGYDTDVPRCEIGLNLGANFKGFYFDTWLQSALGRTVNLRSQAPYSASPLYYDRNVSKFIKHPWTAEASADPARRGNIDFPSLSIENVTNNFQQSTFWQRNGNFLRMRSLEVGYSFPKSWISRLKMSSVKLYVRGMNLFSIDHMDGYFDPEVVEGYPVMKSYHMGLNIIF